MTESMRRVASFEVEPRASTAQAGRGQVRIESALRLLQHLLGQGASPMERPDEHSRGKIIAAHRESSTR
jgi:hypothetical protein